jgi:hypothetical protein
MILPLYIYSDNSKVYVSTSIPQNLSSFPIIDFGIKLPFPYVFVDELMMSLQNNPSQNFIYRLLVDVSEEIVATFPVENGKMVASVWVCPEVSSGNIYFCVEPFLDPNNSHVLVLDPPQPIDVNKLKEFSDIYSNSIRRMSGSKAIIVKITIRISVN